MNCAPCPLERAGHALHGPRFLDRILMGGRDRRARILKCPIFQSVEGFSRAAFFDWVLIGV